MVRNLNAFLCSVILFIIFTGKAGAQQENARNDSLLKDALKIYIDCSFCDLDYIRQEIKYINYVRDPKQAQVFILGTSRTTGSGGSEYMLTFSGKREFEGANDTLVFSMPPNSTEEEVRKIYLKKIKIGLVRYIERTPYSDNISVDFQGQGNNEKVEDKWDNWVFGLNLNSYFSGEENTSYNNLYSSISANRVTPDLKLEFSGSNSYNESRYTYYQVVTDPGNGSLTKIDTIKYLSLSRSYSFNGLGVVSLGQHWSAGGSVNVFSSTYYNYRLRARVTPAIEYNLFPYEQSTRRQLRVLLSGGYEGRQYYDTTIYNKIRESFFIIGPSVAAEVKEEWGSLSSSLSGIWYMHDITKFSMSLWSALNIRVFEGLSFNLSGNFSFIRDQIFLPRGGATPEEILTSQRKNATQYEYWGSVGISYSFGSIYNNVVNPRFGG